MGKFLFGAVVGALAFFVYDRQIAGGGEASSPPIQADLVEVPERADPPAAAARFTCDGRTRCSQMTSCEESMHFLRNCPAVEMDGDGDGVPCEQQWCTHAR